MDKDDKRRLITDEIATPEKDIDLFAGYIRWLENPDPVLLSQGNGRGIRLYDEVDRDSHAGSVLDTRYLAVAGREWTVEPAGVLRRDRAVAEFVTNTLLGCNFSTSVREIMQAVLYGFYVSEIIWKRANAGIVVGRFITKHPRRFVFDTDRSLRLLTPENMIDGDAVPDRKFITFTFGSTDNPYGKGLGQRLWWPVWFKKHGIKFWMIFLDKFGSPTAVGTYPPGTSLEQQQALLEAIDTIQQETGVKIPNNMAIDLLEAARSGSPGYEAMCDYMDSQMSKSVLGQTLTTEVKGQGSYAASQTHDGVRGDILKADADMLSECFNNSLIPWLVDYNYPGIAAYPKLWIRTDAAADLNALSERDERLVNQIGLPVSRHYFYTTYDIPEPGKDDEVVGGATAGAEKSIGNDTGPVEYTEFASDTESAAVKAQGEIDRLIDDYVPITKSIIGKQVDLIKKRLEKLGNAPDLCVFRELYDATALDGLAELLFRAMTAADRIGGGSGQKYSEALWGPGTPFEAALDYFRERAFIISGITHAGLLAEIKAALEQAMAEGLTMEAFMAGFDAIMIRHGYDMSEPYRIMTIFRTNVQSAYQAGRYRQMTSDAVIRARPYWRYSAVMDVSTRPTHAAMHGKIFPNDHRFWQTWYPPNGYNCRCTVHTVSARELETRGWNVETEDPTHSLIEPIDPATGQRLPARSLMPDPGWGEKPGGLEALYKLRKQAERGLK